MTPNEEAVMQCELAQDAMRGEAIARGISVETADAIIEAGRPHLDVMMKALGPDVTVTLNSGEIYTHIAGRSHADAGFKYCEVDDLILWHEVFPCLEQAGHPMPHRSSYLEDLCPHCGGSEDHSARCPHPERTTSGARLGEEVTWTTDWGVIRVLTPVCQPSRLPMLCDLCDCKAVDNVMHTPVCSFHEHLHKRDELCPRCRVKVGV